MPDMMSAAVLEDLPDDIVVGKILMLLPPNDIGRCRVVRKSWRSATSTPEFMVKHRRRQPSLPIVNENRDRGSCVARPAAVAARATSQQVWPFPSSPHGSSWGPRLHASSDGFLIVSRGEGFYICNPTTRKHLLLPFRRPPYPSDIYIHGLYHHKSTGEYRVLWSNVDEKEQGAALYVHTVGANESRSIQLVLPTLPISNSSRTPLVLSPEEMHQLIVYISWTAPVHQCGNLHWLFRSCSTLGMMSTINIIAFDTEAESFRWMRKPPLDDDLFLRCLFDMEGALAVVAMPTADDTPDDTTMAVWVVQDYEAETWAFKYRIDVSMIEASRPLEPTSPKETRKSKLPLDSTVRFFSGMTQLNEHELLVSFNGQHVLRCDTDGKFLGMVTVGKTQYCVGTTNLRLQESIMPIPSGEMQEEDEEFPISTWYV